ncbi:hypothetical protein B9G98_00148 [Wickerhamiella sorbophila]|uniref:Cytochrome P450 52A13 n=1 Tax=Wickerhamiella sorbophila TaxID=45607 RepID=A0A2T0FC01_9ASCO|nr:hypothetical protein B9G98_00148 [Wickerhamiella sorbophila]PRT52528.1 hypothetical protein B9G98_00148 [Wickerhamiella sorbophila]
MILWVLILGILLFALTYDFYLKWSFTAQAKRAGLEPVPVVLDYPLGIRTLFRSLSAVRRKESLEKMIENFRAKEKLTFTEEILGMFIVVTLDPENVKSMLATNFKSYSLGIRADQLNCFLGDGIFTLSGAGWKHSRNLLRPQFSREQVAQIDSIREHFSHVEAVLDREEFVDIQTLFHHLTMDTATEFLLGESVDSLLDSQREVYGMSCAQFVKDYTECVEWCLTRIQFGPLFRFVYPKSFREAIARSRKFVEYFVDKALAKPIETESESYTFIYELAKVTRDRVTIRDQALNILIAGRDTTASLLSYSIWHLAHHPEVYRKLRKELIEAFGPVSTKSVTFEKLKSCTYLKHVINEVLRLNPAVPRNIRTAEVDTQLPRGGGPDGQDPVFIAKGTNVMYAVHEMHRQPAIWGEDAEVFRPERWETFHPKGWEYLPFNGGPRICLGQQFALTEASFVLTRIAQKYDSIELQDPAAPLVNDVNLTARVYGGVWVKMHQADI